MFIALRGNKIFVKKKLPNFIHKEPFTIKHNIILLYPEILKTFMRHLFDNFFSQSSTLVTLKVSCIIGRTVGTLT